MVIGRASNDLGDALHTTDLSRSCCFGDAAVETTCMSGQGDNKTQEQMPWTMNKPSL